MNVNIRRGRTLIVAAAVLMAMAWSGLALAADKILAGPSDDRWHYPFNATPGTRANGGTFTTNSASFDYRDAMVHLRFRPETVTTSDPEYIRPGMCPDCYLFTGAKVVIWHNNATTYTWDTNGNTTDSVGNPFRLQIFGMGNDDSLTSTHVSNPFMLETWVETKPFYGMSPGPPNPTKVRNPFPLNIDPLGIPQNVTNVTGATPWGLGQPVYGANPGEYTPGTIPPAPFPVTYTLDVANPRVRAYIQESLSKGRIDWTLAATALGTSGRFPDFLMKEHTANLPAQFILTDFSYAPSRTVTLDGPAEDRWHYPFNGTPGTRTSGPLFTSTPGGFDYRDAMDYFRFRPETVNPLDPEYIQPGLSPEDYHVARVTLTVWSTTDTGGLPFTWDTRDTITTDSLGNTQAIQLFGMGNHDNVTTPSFSLASWVQTSPFFGMSPFPGAGERNPFPLNLDALSTDTVTNNPLAEPWALGEVSYGTGTDQYTPGVIPAAPFPITFTLDMENTRVRDYVQDSLSLGRIDWVLSGTFTGGGSSQLRPQIIMKENALNKPARLTIEFCDPPPNAVSTWSQYE